MDYMTPEELRAPQTKEMKYRHALEVIDNALAEWAFDAMNGLEFTYFVDGVIQTTKDWEVE